MIVYENELVYNKDKVLVRTERKPSKIICDFTGKELNEDDSCVYTLNYGCSDPNYGCGEGEFEFAEKWGIDIYSLFQEDYHFDENLNEPSILERIMQAVKEDPDMDRMYFDQIFRWCRVKMVDRLLEKKTYTLEEFGLERENE